MSSALQFILLVVAGTAAVWMIGLFVRRAMRAAKNGSRGSAAIAWTLLFFSSGRMPPPPPQEYTEQEVKQRKSQATGRADHGE